MSWLVNCLSGNSSAAASKKSDMLPPGYIADLAEERRESLTLPMQPLRMQASRVEEATNAGTSTESCTETIEATAPPSENEPARIQATTTGANNSREMTTQEAQQLSPNVVVTAATMEFRAGSYATLPLETFHTCNDCNGACASDAFECPECRAQILSKHESVTARETTFKIADFQSAVMFCFGISPIHDTSRVVHITATLLAAGDFTKVHTPALLENSHDSRQTFFLSLRRRSHDIVGTRIILTHENVPFYIREMKLTFTKGHYTKRKVPVCEALQLCA